MDRRFPPVARAALLALPLLALPLLAACARRGGSGAEAAGPVRPEMTDRVPPTPVPAESRQLLVVRTRDWDDIHGTLQLFERTDAGAAWRPVGPATPIVVGRTGLAWGRGLHGAAAPLDGPTKHEGDGKSPAGAFTLSRVFGYAPADSMRGLRMPYVQATSELKCVDDPAAPQYNTLVRLPGGQSPAWTSAEEMRLASDAYRIGVFVDHNAGERRAAGGGSCIFLHVWGGPDSPTVGCTAMPLPRMEEVARWLDPRAHPVLVQLPEAAYAQLREPWRLPAGGVGAPVSAGP